MPGLIAPGPADDERHARAAFPDRILAAAERPGRLVVAELLDGEVLVAVVEHRAVVAGEDHQRVVGQLQAVERREQLADAPVELHDRVAAGPIVVLPTNRGVRHARHVDVVRGEVEEERLVLVPLDELDALAREGVGHVFVFPERGLAALHVADAADAVDDRHVVAVAPVELQAVAFADAGRLAGDRLCRS